MPGCSSCGVPGRGAKEAYSNAGFRVSPGKDRGSNSRLEVRTFQAYNRTFVGDEGEEELFLEPAASRRSFASPSGSLVSYPSPSRPVLVGYHKAPQRWEGRGSAARRSLGFDDSDGEYVDSPEERLGLRQSPLGSSGSFRPWEMRTPSKRDQVILAPMIADAERVRRQQITRSPQRCLIPSQLQESQVPTGLVAVHRVQARLPTTPPRRNPPAMAVITPNFRGSMAPLLTRSPPRHQASPELYKPSARHSWANLPTIHLPTELLCCTGFTLLSCGAASIILSFYILAVGGRKYFLNFGAVSGFTTLVLGLLSCRTNKWKWHPHRNYITGYILLSTFSLLQTAALGGVIYSLSEGSYALVDTLGGAVCGLAILVILGSLIGVVTSHCCHRPPPDNRVAHSAAGFTV